MLADQSRRPELWSVDDEDLRAIQSRPPAAFLFCFCCVGVFVVAAVIDATRASEMPGVHDKDDVPIELTVAHPDEDIGERISALARTTARAERCPPGTRFIQYHGSCFPISGCYTPCERDEDCPRRAADPPVRQRCVDGRRLYVSHHPPNTCIDW